MKANFPMLLVPAISRGLDTADKVEAAFRAGKDFRIIRPKSHGTYCSIRDIEPGTKIRLLYDQYKLFVDVEV